MKMSVSELKEYYEKYYKNSNINEEEIKEELDSWKYYRKKIINKELTAKEYNSKNSNFKDGEHTSLRNFIENETGEVGSFGSMISGQMVLWVKNDGEQKEYYWKVKDSNGKLKSDEESKLNGEDEIENKEKEMNNFLYHVVKDEKNLDKLIEYFKDEGKGKTIYESIRRNFLEKLIIFNSMIDDTIEFDYHNKLIFIYDFSNLSKIEIVDGKNNLFEVLKGNENNLIKNREITANVLKALCIENPNYMDLVKIERMLWNLTESEDRRLLLSKEKKNIIFYGAPGTGKTYIVKKILGNKSINDIQNDDETLEENENNQVNPEDIITSYVQFHPSFTYEDFIEGIKPLGIDNNGNLKLGVVNGCFKDFCIEAKKHPNKEFYFVVDEINRCNLSSVFGETLSLLEYDYRWSEDKKYENLLETPLSKVIESMINNEKDEDKKQELKDKYAFEYKDNKVYFGIPKNIHFIGMMNDCDKSIDSFDLALRRRFIWIRKGFDESALYISLLNKDVRSKDINTYIDACKRLNQFITGEDYGVNTNKESLKLGKTFEIGHAIFMKVGKDNSRKFKRQREEIWNEHLETTIKEYLRSSYLESDIDSKLNEAKELFLK